MCDVLTVTGVLTFTVCPWRSLFVAPDGGLGGLLDFLWNVSDTEVVVWGL